MARRCTQPIREAANAWIKEATLALARKEEGAGSKIGGKK
jgi:hypothetical protein